MQNHVLARGLLVVALLFPGCGSERDPGGEEAPPFERRALPADVLARPAIAYSGYRTGQSPDLQKYPSEAQIREDLALVTRAGFSFLRLFDAGTHAERVIGVIAADHLDVKVMLGVWIAGAKASADAANQDQIERAVKLATAHPEIVAAVSVGNETLDSWSNVRTPVKDLAAYVRAVRARVPQPVTTDDSWLPFSLGTDGDTSYADVIDVARECDFLSLHVYAFADAFYDGWDYKQTQVDAPLRARAMMDAALSYTRESVASVREAMASAGLEIPLVIGEAGWKDATAFSPKNQGDAPEDAIEFYFAHPVNQRMFYDDLAAWGYGATKDAGSPAAIFYFEAFDEPWKGEWGDDHWGLFDVDRKAKYALWSRVPGLKPEGAEAPPESAAVYYVAP